MELYYLLFDTCALYKLPTGTKSLYSLILRWEALMSRAVRWRGQDFFAHLCILIVLFGICIGFVLPTQVWCPEQDDAKMERQLFGRKTSAWIVNPPNIRLQFGQTVKSKIDKKYYCSVAPLHLYENTSCIKYKFYLFA